MQHPPVLTSVDARGVATLTLNRPDVGNAYDGALIAAATASLDTLRDRTDLRVLVIRGEGRHFRRAPTSTGSSRFASNPLPTMFRHRTPWQT